ncbi:MULTISPECIES: lysophospholipid acyltransferase family protein [Paenibacillus]|jgi:1-acyl-sn-glycerol-3-phosphate acyltransferase|uniref:Acyl-phosphate glycerol 3-phosphate acyltransferase n=2 Tax=Paenibacillus TaxID=44249 RepID=A0A168PNP1_9BACL|nr:MULTISPECIES: lysophospholipid acyltransferase family protein [Paenibacillus]MEC0089786.1 lysophospholipid acyltransferase family protein [Paenibacillus macquariensis]OAB30744.1 acyl-phosphate glycerol 3-phosphate acyltransferase [Paenibacillus macquariensis subsp. macquariensis]OAB46938.1 acyl-phosphate glycerol 3-phosphate acyltransferase [Paenibacillus antarcticus]SIQ31171.1 1-acyl-sn-glycerol-3-phosphate acyltransferase [Paenibacillus macquariensis]
MIYVFCRGLLRLIFAVLYRLETVGKNHIPTEGGVLLCANHISVMDPITVGIKLKRQVKYMAKAELFDIPVFGWLLRQLGAFPVKRGGVSKESIRLSINILRDGQLMGIFPEGTRNSTTGVAKKGAASFALRSKATVIPAAIIGEYKLFRKMKVIYGAPVDLTEFMEEGTGDQLEAVTERIMSRIYEMQKTGKPSLN